MGLTSVADRTADDLSVSLARVALSLEKTRELHEILGGYCHQSRNSLNSLKISLYLCRRGAGPGEDGSVWREIEARYLDLERFFDQLQGIFRPLPLSRVRLSLSLLIDDRKASWARELEARGRRLVLDAPTEPAVGFFDPVRLATALEGLVAWRCRAGAAKADLRVAWGVEGQAFSLVFDEPAREPFESVAPEAVGPDSGATDVLTLPLLARIVTLHGGSLDAGTRDPWRLRVHWPLDATSPQPEAHRC